MKKIGLVFLLLGLITLAWGQTRFSGFVETYYGARLQDDCALNSSRSQLRGEVFHRFDNASLFASVNATQNRVLTDGNTAELREAFVEYLGDGWDLRMGRQIVVWGQADGLRITDLICPADYNEFMTRELDDIRIPQEMVKFRALPSWADIELIWLPVFQPAQFAESTSPWHVGPDWSGFETILPDQKGKNSEIAGKMSMYFSGLDVAVSAAHLWDDFPIMDRQTQTLQHHRYTVCGGELSASFEDFVLRMEAAMSFNKTMQTQAAGRKKEELHSMVGIDSYPGNDLTVTAQLENCFILDYDDDLLSEESEATATLSISKKYLRQALELKNRLLFSFLEGDFYDQIACDYAFTDHWHFGGGVDWFSGDRDGVYGKYQDQTQGFVKAKYSF